MTDRPYLLERVDEAAIAQLYADGFRALPLREKILAWHLYNAALAGRDIFYDQRYAHGLEMREVLEGDRDASGRHRRGHAGRDPSLHEALLAQQRPVQQPDGAQVRAPLHAVGVSQRPRMRAADAGARFPLRDGESLDALLGAAGADVLRSGLRAGLHEQDTWAAAATSWRRARTTCTRA